MSTTPVVEPRRAIDDPAKLRRAAAIFRAALARTEEAHDG